MTQRLGTIRVLRHESNVLRSNPLGDPFVRDLPVYLPPGYEDSSYSFPVVFFLSGFAGRGQMLLNDSPFAPNMRERLDRLILDGKIRPLIGVMPDCFTRYGGSQYLNSPATGQYEDYVINELVEFIDENFRTLQNSATRAVAGISSGGYGALRLSMMHPEVFGLAASIAGDCYFEACYKPDLFKGFRGIAGDTQKLLDSFFDETAAKGKYAFDGLNIIGMSACYSPNPNGGFDLPFDPETGILREDVWKRWLLHDPLRMVQENLENLKRLSLLYLDAGTKDEFNLDIGARALSSELSKFGIAHIHTEFDGGHFGIKHRYDPALVAISNATKSR
ncbi:MAG: alpha/beta hydrolase-fold protein [Pyrinomonadaceae bacterium]